MKHTKGPWVDRNKGIAHAVGEVYAANEYICTTSGNAKANAQLIAAAPDLLEALMNYTQVIGRFLETMPDEFVIDIIAAAFVRDAHANALLAIEKATGKKEGTSYA